MQNLNGNIANDILLSFIAFPFVAVQIDDEAVAAAAEGADGPTKEAV